MANKPTIVCLCGSTRFMGAWKTAAAAEALAGKIVLSVQIITTSARKGTGLGEHISQETKAMLDALHLRKIDLADEVLILNVGGYIGESTGKELAYAREHGKGIRFLEATDGE